MKNKLLLLGALATLTTSLTSCGAMFGNEIQFWVYGSKSEVATFTTMTNEFNRTYGKEHGFSVKITSYPADGSYTSVIKASATTTSGPDVFLVVDDLFKTYVHLGICGSFEEEYNAVVYHVIHSHTNFGELLSLLYVSEHEEEWEYDREDLEEGIAVAYVENLTYWDCSEMGSIGIEPRNGGLARTA